MKRRNLQSFRSFDRLRGDVKLEDEYILNIDSQKHSIDESQVSMVVKIADLDSVGNKNYLELPAIGNFEVGVQSLIGDNNCETFESIDSYRNQSMAFLSLEVVCETEAGKEKIYSYPVHYLKHRVYTTESALEAIRLACKDFFLVTNDLVLNVNMVGELF